MCNEELNGKKAALEKKIKNLEGDIEYTLWHAKKMLKEKTLSNTKQLIESLADRVIIYEDYIQIKFTFAKTKDYNFDPPTKEELVENGQKNNLGVTDVTPICGGEGALPAIFTICLFWFEPCTA